MKFDNVLWKGKNHAPIIDSISLFLIATLLIIGFNSVFGKSILVPGASLFIVVIYVFNILFLLIVHYFLYRILLKDKFKWRYFVSLNNVMISIHNNSNTLIKSSVPNNTEDSIIKKIEVKAIQKVVIRRTIYGFEFRFHDKTSEIIKFEGVKEYLSLIKVLKGLLGFNLITNKNEVIFQRVN